MMSNFYKIECKDTLKLIDDFFDKRDLIYSKIKKMCDHYGFEMHVTHDSIQNGIRFLNMSANPNDDIDKTKWKTSKHRSGYLNIEPRASNKEHKAEYMSMKPKSMEYTELNKLTLKTDVLPWSKSYGYRYKKGKYFMFETSLDVSDKAIEIFGSEYRKGEENDH